MIGGQGTWSAVLGPAGASNPGYWTTGDQTLPGGAKTFTGGPWTFTRTAVASSAETLATFKISDDSVSKIEIKNDAATDNFFMPAIFVTGPTTNRVLTIYGRATTDTGTAPVISFDAATAAAAAITTRPLFSWYNAASAALQMLPLNSGANSCLSWGTQGAADPTFTSRSAGNRLILYSALSGSQVDYAVGIGSAKMFLSIPQANSGYSLAVFGGTTNIASIRGDGLLTTTGGRVVKLRVALTTPVTVAVTDHVVATNLSSAGAVAVNLPATPTTGTEFIVKDDKGDAGANNITITPAAGNIDGAGTLVLNANYAVAKLVYNGTQWNRIGS